jgi:hypothetical protein
MYAAMLDAVESGLTSSDYTSSTIEALQRRGWIRLRTITQRGHSRTSVYEATPEGHTALKELR